MITLLLLSGLCFLPALSERVYFVVEIYKTWAEAQSYCREKYTDLATVDNNEELQKLRAAGIKYDSDSLWIGLYDDIHSWRWSLQKEGYYGPGQAQFRAWRPDSPDNYDGYQFCGSIMTDGTWNDVQCSLVTHFICFDERSTPSFIHVTEPRNWSEAQSYCRVHHTDLASVRSQTENDQLKVMLSTTYTFIGLYRDSWKWSDGSPGLFRKWSSGRPSGQPCAFLSQGLWSDYGCNTTMYSICYAVQVKQLVVKLRVKRPSSLNLEDVTEAISQQLRQILEMNGQSKNLKLTWRKQPDGNIFYREETTDNSMN